MSDCIQGLWVATLTPIAPDGSIDRAALAAHADTLLRQGMDGVVLFGTTGEGTSFSAGERLAAVEALLAHGIPPDRIALGAGFPAFTDSIALAKDAIALGLTHMLLLPPYFYRDVAPAGIEAAFAAIIDGIADPRLRATLYSIPQVSGVGVPPETLANLRARYGATLAGLKDSSGDFAQFQAFRAAAPEAAITIGNEADIARARAQGGAGTICGMANVVPDLVRAMFSDTPPTHAMQDAIALIQGPFVPTVKSAMAALANEPAWARVRTPLQPAPAALGRRIADGLHRLRQPRAA